MLFWMLVVDWICTCPVARMEMDGSPSDGVELGGVLCRVCALPDSLCSK